MRVGMHCDAFQGQPKACCAPAYGGCGLIIRYMARYSDAEQNMWRLRESINLVHLHLLNRIHAEIAPETLNFTHHTATKFNSILTPFSQYNTLLQRASLKLALN